MKKIVLGTALALLALGLVVPAAWAEPGQSTAGQAFLASLALPAAPAPVAKGSAGSTEALCTATANCWNGTTVNCEGNNSSTSCSATDSNCPTTRGGVTCDGSTILCPACPTSGCGPNFCTDQDEFNCALSCSPCDYTFTCNTSFCFERCRCNFSTCPV